MSAGDDADKKAHKTLERMRNVDGGAIHARNFHSSIVGTIASGPDGDATHALGSVTAGDTSSSVPVQGIVPVTKAGKSQNLPVADFVILTTLQIERQSVCNMFGIGDDDRVIARGRVYWLSRLRLPDGNCYQIVVAQPLSMGILEAEISAEEAIQLWAPRAVITVGIAVTTRPKEVTLGDVVVGRSVYYYEHGKASQAGADPQQLHPEIITSDVDLLQHSIRVADRVADLLMFVPEPRPDHAEHQPKVHQGVIAFGQKAIVDAATRDAIAAGHRKILAISMEGLSFSGASRAYAHVSHIDVRGICDDGSETKDDRWNKYAASAAASFVRQFLLHQPLRLFT